MKRLLFSETIAGESVNFGNEGLFVVSPKGSIWPVTLKKLVRLLSNTFNIARYTRGFAVFDESDLISFIERLDHLVGFTTKFELRFLCRYHPAYFFTHYAQTRLVSEREKKAVMKRELPELYYQLYLNGNAVNENE